MIGLSKKQILSYVFMPQLRSRFGSLFASGFGYIPYFIALVYQIVRLLPENHPYLNPKNMGQFGIRHVIAEAANNLVLKKNNIDQYVLFIVVLTGFVLLLIQISLLVTAAFVQPVLAATIGTNFEAFFGHNDTPPDQDIAMIMLDMVFGVEKLFNSCVTAYAANAAPGVQACVDSNGEELQWLLSGTQWPFPIHTATHTLFSLYSTGLLVVAALITSYFIITVIAETAQTGTPFGKRFNKVWAPLRLIVAVGLLIPLAQGINGSQYIVLYAAKYGSNFATNGWNLFNDTLSPNPQAGNSYVGGGSNSDLVATPIAPEITGLMQMIFTAKVCRELELARTIEYDEDDYDLIIYTEPYLVKDTISGANEGSLMLNESYGQPPTSYTSYEDMIEFADGASYVTIRFGHKDKENFGDYKGYVKPVCGEIIFPLSDPRPPKLTGDPEDGNYSDRGAEIMQRTYWFIINTLWYWVYDYNPTNPINHAQVYVEEFSNYLPAIDTDRLPKASDILSVTTLFKAIITAALVDPNTTFVQPDPTTGLCPDCVVNDWVSGITNIGQGAVIEQALSPKFNVNNIMREKGWAGAAIWYNKIAELNGSLAAATYSAPIISRYPAAMETIATARKKIAEYTTAKDRFNPKIPGDEAVKFNPSHESQYVNALWQAYQFWSAGDSGATSQTAIENNPITDVINQIFGTSGLFQMRENRNVHPLAQLVHVGRTLMQSATNALGVAAAIGVAGAVWTSADNQGEFALAAFVGPIMSVVLVTLTIGFLLFYVVPFLPFIYFFFAVGQWIKGIFEAMVGAPLWALAHIRIDGNGLPGQAAAPGYFLVFEIFLRPILIIFGLLASISTFSALVSVMNDTWDIVTTNLTGGGREVSQAPTSVSSDLTAFVRGPIDTFFYTMVYAIVVYMMGMSSFKLIDLIPNNILRWIGHSTATFNDQQEDGAQGLVNTAGIGSQQTISSLSGGVGGVLGDYAKGGGKKQ